MRNDTFQTNHQINLAHQDLVARLKKNDEQICRSLVPGDCDMAHMMMGGFTEMGELGTAIKAYLFYRKPLDRANVIEELGDLEFFLEGLRSRLGISRGETLLANIDKLNKRYGTGIYSDVEARARKDKQ